MPDTQAIDRHSHNPLVRYFRILGPGLITGASAVMSLAALAFFATAW